MKRKFASVAVLLILVFILSLGLVACDDDKDSSSGGGGVDNTVAKTSFIGNIKDGTKYLGKQSNINKKSDDIIIQTEVDFASNTIKDDQNVGSLDVTLKAQIAFDRPEGNTDGYTNSSIYVEVFDKNNDAKKVLSVAAFLDDPKNIYINFLGQRIVIPYDNGHQEASDELSVQSYLRTILDGKILPIKGDNLNLASINDIVNDILLIKDPENWNLFSAMESFLGKYVDLGKLDIDKGGSIIETLLGFVFEDSGIKQSVDNGTKYTINMADLTGLINAAGGIIDDLDSIQDIIDILNGGDNLTKFSYVIDNDGNMKDFNINLALNDGNLQSNTNIVLRDVTVKKADNLVDTNNQLKTALKLDEYSSDFYVDVKMPISVTGLTVAGVNFANTDYVIEAKGTFDLTPTQANDIYMALKAGDMALLEASFKGTTLKVRVNHDEKTNAILNYLAPAIVELFNDKKDPAKYAIYELLTTGDGSPDSIGIIDPITKTYNKDFTGIDVNGIDFSKMMKRDIEKVGDPQDIVAKLKELLKKKDNEEAKKQILNLINAIKPITLMKKLLFDFVKVPSEGYQYSVEIKNNLLFEVTADTTITDDSSRSKLAVLLGATKSYREYFKPFFKNDKNDYNVYQIELMYLLASQDINGITGYLNKNPGKTSMDYAYILYDALYRVCINDEDISTVLSSYGNIGTGLDYLKTKVFNSGNVEKMKENLNMKEGKIGSTKFKTMMEKGPIGLAKEALAGSEFLKDKAPEKIMHYVFDAKSYLEVSYGKELGLVSCNLGINVGKTGLSITNMYGRLYSTKAADGFVPDVQNVKASITYTCEY